jgi:hypothetical protein
MNEGRPTEAMNADELLPEYSFDYQQAKPNRFAPKVAAGSMVVILEPELAQAFATPEAVKRLLRALVEAMPQSSVKG